MNIAQQSNAMMNGPGLFFPNPGAMRKPKCVVVDDEPGYLQLLRMYQHRLGLEVNAYESIMSLGRISQLTEYDVAILDYRMPGVDGLEIAQCANALFSYLPIVLVTGCDPHEIPWGSVGPNVRAIVSKSEGVARVGEALWAALQGNGWQRENDLGPDEKEPGASPWGRRGN